MKLSRMADYAVTLTSIIAQQPEELHTVAALAVKTGLGVPTISQILKKLTRYGLLSSVRGANGGYCLAMGAETVTMVHVIEAMEGPISLTRCLSKSKGGCSIESLCNAKNSWEKVNNAIKDALSKISLADVSK